MKVERIHTPITGGYQIAGENKEQPSSGFERVAASEDSTQGNGQQGFNTPQRKKETLEVTEIATEDTGIKKEHVGVLDITA